MASQSIPQFESHANNTPEPFDPQADLTGREFLALFVQTLRGCDFIYDIEGAIERTRKPELTILQDEDYLELIAQYWLLESVLTSVAGRAARNAGEGEGE